MSNGIEVKVEVSRYYLFSALVSAFEGGSNYWMRRATSRDVQCGVDLDAFVDPDDGEKIDSIDATCAYVWPLFEGGSMGVDEIDHDYAGEEDRAVCEFTLTIETLRRGLALMASKAPKHFADLVTSSGDAETGDVLLQFATLGELRYG